MIWMNIDKPTKTITTHKPNCNYIPKKEPKHKGIERELRDGGWFAIGSDEYDRQFFYNIYPEFKRKTCNSCK
ncbi:hypothetical protein [Oceanobacillus bengalensis]